MPIRWQKNCFGSFITGQAERNRTGKIKRVSSRKTRESPSTPSANVRLYSRTKLNPLINWYPTAPLSKAKQAARPTASATRDAERQVTRMVLIFSAGVIREKRKPPNRIATILNNGEHKINIA